MSANRRMMVLGFGVPNDEFPPVPTSDIIVGLSASSGGIAGGTAVRVYVTFARKDAVIKFGGSVATITNASYGELGHFDVTTPAHAAGTVDVNLVDGYTPNGTNFVNGFTYTGVALTKGTATALRGDGVISLTATTALNGTGPYSYQWYNSSGGVIGLPVPGATSLHYLVTGLVNGVAKSYRLRATDALAATVDYDEVTATPQAASSSFTRGPGANQPVGHTQLFQLDTTQHDQRVGITATQPAGQTTSTNGDTLNDLGGDGSAAGFAYIAKWQDGIHTLFNQIDPSGEVSWPIMEWHWLPGDPVDGYSGLCTLVSMGPLKEIYYRHLYFIETNFQVHKSGDLKGIRLYRNSAPHVHVHNRFIGSYPYNNVFTYRLPNDQGSKGLWQAGFSGLTPPSKGIWLDLEARFTMEEPFDAMNGTFASWLNGQLITNWTQFSAPLDAGAHPLTGINWCTSSPAFFNKFHLGMFRGGSGGDPILTDSIVRVAEIFVSGKL